MDTAPPFVHRIRLRGPWDFAWLTEDATPPSGEALGTLSLPLSWYDAFGDVDGRVRLSRHFNRPTSLDDNERVWLEVGVTTSAAVALNGQTIAQMEAGTARFDVTGRLEPRCRVDVDIERRGATGRSESLLDIALVIESIGDP